MGFNSVFKGLIASRIPKLGLDGSNWSIPGHFNAWRRTTVHFEYTKTNIHVQSYKTGTHKNFIINMGIKSYNKKPGYVKQTDNYKAFKKELK